ncbi:hypothetical protein ACHAXA_004108 [Cyclostephanos tholiformis]|uniref:DUF1995 domain-containing protein n=1 Tax=Cyclostephanos tholiformis TaxID=382380 RepID=A0ABD3SGX5_9STRA
MMQLEFCMAYLNEHHKSDVLLPFIRAFSELGPKSVQKNMWMGGSYSIEDAEITCITSDNIRIVATIREGRKTTNESVTIALDGDPVLGMTKTFPTLPRIDPFILNRESMVPIDNFCRRFIRLCNIVKAYDATGKMIQLGVQLGGKGVGKLQSVRGRQQRLDFVNSFETIYQFQNMYRSGTSYFPILGSVVKLGPLEPWVAHQRRDLVNDGGEVYLPVFASETQPDGEVLMATFSS